jgi:hypothetical protein
MRMYKIPYLKGLGCILFALNANFFGKMLPIIHYWRKESQRCLPGKAVACQATHQGSIPSKVHINSWGQVHVLGSFDRRVTPCCNSLAEQKFLYLMVRPLRAILPKWVLAVLGIFGPIVMLLEFKARTSKNK